jgi:hypothetical protein
MNVVTSLLGLVIVSHLSPKGSGRFTLTVGQLVRFGLQNLGDDERPFPGRRELVPPSGVLSQPKHQVAHLEVSGPNPSGVVALQGLLVPRRV